MSGGMAQVVECLPHKHKFLSSIPRPEEEERRRRRRKKEKKEKKKKKIL
jgi:hypothetical protein